jgi:hypothetical protein
MNTKAVAIVLGIVLGLGQPSSAAVRQVRVTVLRAAIYVEPNRNSTRIDLVEKGDLLNLFQEQKVKNVWYYVVYNSPRYGSRISGFIQAAAVELVTEETTPAEKPAPAPIPAGPEQKPKKVEPVPMRPPVETPPPETGRAAPKPTPAQEATVVQKPAPGESREVAGLTPVPRARLVSLPCRAPAVDDRAWAILQPAVPEIKKEAEKAPQRVPPPAKPAPEQVPKKIERQPQKPPVETPPPEPKKAAAKPAPARAETIIQNP